MENRIWHDAEVMRTLERATELTAPESVTELTAPESAPEPAAPEMARPNPVRVVDEKREPR